MKQYPKIIWLFSGDIVGQLKILDMAYALIETKWIFHCEDDWEFVRPGWIELSIEYLKQHEEVINLGLMRFTDKPFWNETTFVVSK